MEAQLYLPASPKAETEAPENTSRSSEACPQLPPLRALLSAPKSLLIPSRALRAAACRANCPGKQAFPSTPAREQQRPAAPLPPQTHAQHRLPPCCPLSAAAAASTRSRRPAAPAAPRVASGRPQVRNAVERRTGEGERTAPAPPAAGPRRSAPPGSQEAALPAAGPRQLRGCGGWRIIRDGSLRPQRSLPPPPSALPTPSFGRGEGHGVGGSL